MPKFYYLWGIVSMYNSTNEIIALRKRINEKQSIITILLFSCMTLSLLFIGSIFILINIMIGSENLQIRHESLMKTSESYINSFAEKDSTIEILRLIVEEQDLQIQSLANINKEYVDELNYFRERQELYDKYSYAIIDECGNRTELTYSQIKLAEELMLEKGYDPDLLLGTIMVESRGNPDCVNISSGATGLGQFMNSTAEYVWCKLMGNDYYDPGIMKDPESNIRMMASYYDYLYKTEGDTFSVIKRYSGNATDWGTLQYINCINSFTSKVGEIVY